MEMFHSDLLANSIQQSPIGRLPKDLLNEISEAQALARHLSNDLTPERIREIDVKVSRDQNYWAKDLVLEFTQKKLYSKWLPKMVGGGGGHPLAFYGFNLEMGASCLGISNLIGAHYVAMGLVSATNSFGVLKKITKDIKLAEKNSDHCTVALAITEPGAGSDMEDGELLERARVGTKAEKVNGGYKISGQKIFISNSLFAKWYVGSAFTDLKDPMGSLLIFAVKRETTGINLGRVEAKLGQNASPANVLFFDNVFVPDEDICFSREQFQNSEDFKKNAEFLLNDLLSLSRVGVGCLAAGAQKKILELTLAATKNHQTKEWMQNQIACLAQNFILSKTLSWEGHVECYSRGPYKDLQKNGIYHFFKYTPQFVLENLIGTMLVHPKIRDNLRKDRRNKIPLSDEKLIFGWGALVKGICTDKAMESAQLALEVVSYDTKEYWQLEKILRDVKLLQIYEGTNELNALMCFKNFIGPKDKSLLAFLE